MASVRYERLCDLCAEKLMDEACINSTKLFNTLSSHLKNIGNTGSFIKKITKHNLEKAHFSSVG